MDHTEPKARRRFWYSLVTPPDHLEGEAKRRATQLATLTLVLIPLTILTVFASPVLNMINGRPYEPQEPGYILGILLVVASYILSRTGYYKIGSYLTTSVPVLAVGITLLGASEPASASVLFFLSLSIVLCSLLLDAWDTIATGIVVVIAVIFIYLMKGRVDGVFPTDVISFALITAGVLTVVNLNKERNLKQLSTTNEQLQSALLKAEEADRMKSQFLASMSHELRTPLNGILNFTKLLRKGILGPVNDRQSNTLNEVVDSGQHLLSLINDVLDVSKIQSSMLTLFIEEDVDIYPILNTGISTTKSLIGDKPVTLVEDIDANLPPILCDRRRVQQVLLNLLSNAAKFTDRGTITLSVKNEGSQLRFAIMDTGAGIPEEQHETIFEPFIQTETGIKHSGGTGLGLPIAKSLIEEHDGKIWIESTSGEGSAFMFTLPVESSKLRDIYKTDMEAVHA